MKVLALISLLFASGLCEVNPKTDVELFQHSGYGGDQAYLTDTNDFCYYLSYNDNKASALKIHEGSCSIVYDGYNCDDQEAWFYAFPDVDIANIGDDLNDRISSVTGCGHYKVSAECPENTFVKVINYKPEDFLRGGIELHCYGPKDTEPAAILNVNPGNSQAREDIQFRGNKLDIHQSFNNFARRPSNKMARPENKLRRVRDANVQSSAKSAILPATKTNSVGTLVDCPAIIRVHEINGNAKHHIITGLNSNCDYSEQDNFKRNVGVTGIEVSFENLSNLIKDLTLYGNEVPNPGEFCPPKDEFVLVLDADNLEGTVEREFSYTESIGITTSTVLTEEERKEYAYYLETGLDIGGSGSFLSANFYVHYNESETTGYKWSTAQSNTWASQTTTTIRIPIPPRTHTKAYQVVGRCTFYEVAAYSYKFVDLDADGNIKNVSYKNHL